MRIKLMQKELHLQLQSAEGRLRKNRKIYPILGLFCPDCGRTHPSEAKICHRCNNRTLHDKHCTVELRVAELFAVLRDVKLWPFISPFDACSVSDLVTRFACARLDLKHSCEAAISCPLATLLDALSVEAKGLQEEMKGICLNCVRKGDLKENWKCNCPVTETQ